LKSTRLHFRNYFIGDILKKGIAFLSIPIFTRILSPDEYGIYNIFNSYVSIIFIISTLNTTSSISRYAFEKKSDFNDFVGFNVLVSGCLMLISVVLLFIFNSYAGKILQLSRPLVFLLVPYLVYDFFKTVFEQIYQPLEDSGLISKYNILNSIVTLVLKVGFVFIVYKSPIIGIVSGGAIASIGFAIIYIYKIKAFLKFTIAKKYFIYIMKFCIPLIPYALSGIILNQFDRIMINFYINSSDAGLYSFAYNIGMIFSIFYRALLIRAWVPKYYHYMNNKLYTEHDNDLKKMYKVIVAGAILLILFGKEASIILADKSYYEATPVIPMIVAGYFFESIHYVYLRNAAYSKKTIYSTIVLLSAGVFNIILNAVFIPKYGYIASAVTTLFSYLFMAISAWLINKYRLRMYGIPVKNFILPILILISSLSLYYGTEYFLKNIWLIIIIKVIFALVVMVMMYKDKLIKQNTVSE